MLPNISALEARVIGCLLEKSVLTPDQYPLTLNALTNACNQKSSREPVMSLDPGVVQHTARALAARHFVVEEENFRRGVVKYRQRFCNTRYSDYQFDPAQFAIVCLLLLRGPQTPGELRARSGRLHTFADNEAVVAALEQLIEWPGEPLVVRLPRTPGRKDCEYAQLFGGPIDVEARAAAAPAARPAGERVGIAELVSRIERLESEVAALQRQVSAQ